MLLSRLFFYEKFRSLNNYALICRLNGEKHKKKHTMNNFFKEFGYSLNRSGNCGIGSKLCVQLA